MMKQTVEREIFWLVEYEIGSTPFHQKFFSEADARHYVLTNDEYFDGIDVRLIMREVVTTDTVLKEYHGD